jgi:hypothetical protein
LPNICDLPSRVTQLLLLRQAPLLLLKHGPLLLLLLLVLLLLKEEDGGHIAAAAAAAAAHQIASMRSLLMSPVSPAAPMAWKNTSSSSLPCSNRINTTTSTWLSIAQQGFELPSRTDGLEEDLQLKLALQTYQQQHHAKSCKKSPAAPMAWKKTSSSSLPCSNRINSTT